MIVVDDGSIDSTAAFVASWNELPVHYVNVGGIGLGNARNLATALCRSRYVCILDDDDIMLPNRIGDHMNSFADGVQLSHGGWINFNSRLELDYRPGKAVDEDVVTYVGGAIHHDACCYDAAVLREFPYRTGIHGGEDYDLAVRAVYAGIKAAHTGSYVLLRRRHTESISMRHGPSLDRMRDAVLTVANLSRSDAEIAERRAAGRSQAELAAAACLPLPALYARLGAPGEAMRVVGLMPRAADQLFALLPRLHIELTQLDLIDAASSLTGTIGLACRPSRDLDILGAFEADLRRLSVRAEVLTAPSAARLTQAAPIACWTPPGQFRLALRAPDWRELYWAHRIICAQRNVRWYCAARAELVIQRRQSVYYLISAPFQHVAEPGSRQAFVDELCGSILQHTDLPASVITGEPTQ